MEQIRIAIAGASGRMGRMLIETTLKTEGAVLVAAFERPDSIFIGRDAGEFGGAPCGVPISSDVAEGLARADCLIDFTRPEATLQHLALARSAGCGVVIGTTGFNARTSSAGHPGAWIGSGWFFGPPSLRAGGS